MHYAEHPQKMHAYSCDKVIIIYIDYYVSVVDRSRKGGDETEIINHLSKQQLSPAS